ncbi:hypothetical protein HATV-3_gp35 [Haloarcula tailed virus 3]|uniref:Uncharacterized protein n=1 Tax=Haloarcula tailed virus 3 TaxID=2877990 RepID=A0AAE8XZ67_9CAUD|nr:hypothetical protein M1M35_gp35 [Haloarcula tailed virus 3]UBF23385.1 hypothetical protein HATV-3_gp35 [Haloarcula tailed virus 3]
MTTAETAISYDILTASETIKVPFVTTDWNQSNQRTRGETATIEVNIPNSSDDLVVDADETIASDEVVQHNDVTIQSGVTLTVNGELYANTIRVNGDLVVNGTVTTYGSIIELLNDFDNYAGSVATQEMLDGTIKYKEQLPVGAPVNSLLIGIKPSDDIRSQGVAALWGLVTDVVDTRPRALSINRFEIEVTVVSTFDEYATRSDVTSNLEL